jgi:uncharacterized protein (DUF1697 family)
MRVAALLRGVNLGPNRRLPMNTLRSVVESLGHTDVSTYQQSGNVVFTPARGSRRNGLAEPITKALAAETGHDVAVVTRTGSELAKVVEANPFPVDDPTHLVVVFLGEKVDTGWLRSVGRGQYAPDDLSLKGRHVYLSLPKGQARSKLTEAFWKQYRNDLATARNWRTVVALAEMTA